MPIKYLSIHRHYFTTCEVELHSYDGWWTCLVGKHNILDYC